MSVKETAEAILALPDKGKFTHREYQHQTQWDDTDIGTYEELKAMAKLWLMRKQLLDDAQFLAMCEPPSKAVRQRQERLMATLEQIEALEDNDENSNIS